MLILIDNIIAAIDAQHIFIFFCYFRADRTRPEDVDSVSQAEVHDPDVAEINPLDCMCLAASSRGTTGLQITAQDKPTQRSRPG